jgi:hypothetical protein
MSSDLELVGGHQDILVQAIDCRERTGLCDNIPAVAWHQKSSATTIGPTAYLLRLSSSINCTFAISLALITSKVLPTPWPMIDRASDT